MLRQARLDALLSDEQKRRQTELGICADEACPFRERCMGQEIGPDAVCYKAVGERVIGSLERLSQKPIEKGGT